VAYVHRRSGNVVHPVGVPQRPGVLCGRLAVRPDRRGSFCRSRGVPENCRGIVGAFGVMCEPSEVGGRLRRLLVRTQDAPMELHPPAGRKRLGHRTLCQLVPEGDAVTS
jgi:hypothetical protein